MKSMRLMMGGVLALALALSLSESAMAEGGHNSPKPSNPAPPLPAQTPMTQTVGVVQNAELTAVHNTAIKINLDPQFVFEAPNVNVEGSKSSSTLNVAPGAFAQKAVGIEGDLNIEGAKIEKGAIENNIKGGDLVVGAGALSPKAEAVGVQGGVKTGDNKNEVKIDSHDKNINVMLVPPGLPSLAPAPVIAECANCYIDFLFSAQEISGATTQSEPQVIKGKDIEVAKDVVVTMTSMAGFTGVRKKPGKFGVLSVTVNRVPEKGFYQAVAMITVQAKGKNGHMLTPMELQIRALQAARRLDFPDSTVLYVVFSRKATVEHATLVTTGKGWSIAPGGGGPLGDAIGSVTGTIGRSHGTATNDWTPEVTALVIVPKAGGVDSGAFNALDHQVAQTVSVSK